MLCYFVPIPRKERKVDAEVVRRELLRTRGADEVPDWATVLIAEALDEGGPVAKTVAARTLAAGWPEAWEPSLNYDQRVERWFAYFTELMR
jgi:hypothetical protein